MYSKTNDESQIEENDLVFENDDNKIISEIKTEKNLQNKKKNLIEISKNLSNLEYLEIFNIIKENNCSYSENKNGVFINLSSVSEEIIDSIFDFINFIKHKKEDLKKYEEIVDDLTIKNNTNNIKEVKEFDNQNNNYENNISSDEEEVDTSKYLDLSSDDETKVNKIILKKKKVKYNYKKKN